MHHERDNEKDAGRRGFTLIEMLAVLAIVGILMVVTVSGFSTFGRGAALRGSLLNLRSSLQLTRQTAVTRRTKATFVYDNATNVNGKLIGRYVITNDQGQVIGQTNYLVDGVYFDSEVPDSIQFKYDGSCAGRTTDWDMMPGGLGREIVIREDRTRNSLTATTIVYKLTGMAKGQTVAED